MPEVVLLNPRKKRGGAKRRKYRRNPVLAAAANPKRRRRRSSRKSYGSYRRNPKRLSSMVSLRGVGMNDVLYGAGGMVATETFSPQLLRLIGQSDFGMWGYLGRIATAMVGAWAISSFAKSKKGAQSFLYGGLLGTAVQVWNNEVKPRIGLSGVRGLGYYQPRTNAGGTALVPQFSTVNRQAVPLRFAPRINVR